ncbi:MAG: pyridoxal phosphate-dependent aminotransferase, partial [Gemmatimonadota bacterium]
ADVLRYAHRYGRFGTDGHLIEPSELEARIAERENVPADHVLVAHGATELLQLCAVAFGDGGIATQIPTYGTIIGYANRLGGDIRMFPLREDMHYDLDGFLDGAAGDAGCVYLCHPNNPTGLIEPQPKLEAFCRAAARDAVVVADEAYHEFVEAPGYRSLVALVREGTEVVVLRTFSKAYGMAGIRVGYAVAPPELLRPLRGLQVGPINVVSLVGARAGLASRAFLEESRTKIAATRSRVVERLRRMGLSSLDSQTNFLLVDVGRPVGPVMAGLRSRGVRVASTMLRNSTRFRLTIGTDDEIDTFLDALDAVLARASDRSE